MTSKVFTISLVSSTHGVVYLDSTGLEFNHSSSAATTTSTQLLTAVTEIAITLPSAQSVTEGDLVTQAGGGSQQGVVKTTSNSTTVTLIGVTGTFNTSADLILNGTGTGKTPSAVSTHTLVNPCGQQPSTGVRSALKTMNSQNNDVDVNTLIKIYIKKYQHLQTKIYFGQIDHCND